ncbi:MULTISPECIES: hypothetical protein [Okeania]|uniref:hypothetical protein n=1 Tax=Okeania TaxID=1458928 RepID=UPI0013753918|nr:MULTISPECIES: hypothetical protein [unclassified Okeania]NEQ91217.1 hypothetical protein [Okeania sp. SIO2G4]NET22609.1 hypothetical protein [Okeania sp. SIO1H5]NET77656.1 hypothetical protein [Okeania sp. SIO1F9]NET95760.1 hypothetical protein [Okeania sp. SIO1H2]
MVIFKQGNVYSNYRVSIQPSAISYELLTHFLPHNCMGLQLKRVFLVLQYSG